MDQADLINHSNSSRADSTVTKVDINKVTSSTRHNRIQTMLIIKTGSTVKVVHNRTGRITSGDLTITINLHEKKRNKQKKWSRATFCPGCYKFSIVFEHTLNCKEKFTGKRNSLKHLGHHQWRILHLSTRMCRVTFLQLHDVDVLCINGVTWVPDYSLNTFFYPLELVVT